MNKKTATQSLSKKEKKAKDVIPLLFKYQDKDQWMETGTRLIEFYNGRHYKKRCTTDQFTYNAIFADVQTLIPNLVMNSPSIRCRARRPTYLRKDQWGQYEQIDNIKSARLMEAAINHEYRVINAIGEVKKAIFDPLFWTFGVTKTGYSFNTLSPESENYDTKDRVFLMRICPKDFGFHPVATSCADSPQLCHRIVTTRPRLKKNSSYDMVDAISPSLPKHLQDKFKDMDDDDKDFITLWELHDQEEDLIYTFGGEEKLLLWKRKREHKHKGSDFQLLRFAGEPDEFLGVPLILMVEDEQKAMNEVLSLMINHLHMFPGRVWTEDGMVEEADIEKMKEGGQGAIQTIKNIEKVKFQSPLTMGQDYIAVLNVLQGLQDRTLGVPEFLRSANPQRKSASESAFIQGDVNIRRQYLAQFVKDFMIDGIDNLSFLMQEFYDDEKFIMAEGSIEATPISYTKRDIQGDYQFEFDIDTLSATNETEVQRLINALNVVAAHPALVPILQTLDPIKIGKELFRRLNMNIEAFQIKDIEEVTFIDPNKENLIITDPDHPSVARFGGVLPQPKPNEDHMTHLNTHMPLFDQLEAAGVVGTGPEQLKVHMLLHSRQLEKAQAQMSPALPGPGQKPQPMPTDPGPQPEPTEGGPVNLPGQAIANRVEPYE